MTDDIPRIDMGAEPELHAILKADPAISAHSRWSDAIWRLDGENGGQTAANFAIHWTVKAPPGLIDAAKLLAARVFLERDGEVQLKHTTASTFSAGMRHLLRFMTTFAYTSFSQLDEDAFAHFTRNLHLKLSDPEWWQEEFSDADEEDQSAGDDGDDGDDSDPELDLEGEAIVDEEAGSDPAGTSGKAPDEDDSFTRAAAYYRLRTWRLLLEHADAMERAGVSGLRFNPFAHQSLKELTLKASSIASKLIPPLPDKVALRIMATAQGLMGAPADDVIRLQAECNAQMARLDRQPPTEERQRIRRVIAGFRFSEVDGAPWHAPVVLDEDGGIGDAMRDLFMRIRDAAVMVIFCGTGVRIGELCSLTADAAPVPAPLPLFGADDADDGAPALPHCVSTRTSKTGMNEHFFMHGRLFKNERTPRDEEWLIGSRPLGTDVEPPVLRAIRILERLHAPWRTVARDERLRGQLLLGFKGRGLPRSERGVVPIRSGSLRLSLRRFVQTSCGLEQLAADAENDRKLRPYLHRNGECIRTHQWRKTFALYMMKVDDRMIPPLAHHFKHMSIAVTENSYMPTDPSMLAAQDSVHAQESTRFFYEMRHGAGGRFGRLDDLLEEHRAEWEKLVEGTFEEAVPEVERFCLDRDIRIFHAEHGRCLIGANPDRARCHDAAGTGSWRVSAPNYMARTPGLCVGCQNFSVSAEHAGFWRRRYVSHQTSWLGSDRSPQFRVVQKRAQQAAQILKALGVPLPVVLVEAPSDRRGRRGGARHGAGAANIETRGDAA